MFWRLKILVKTILSKLPLAYGFWCEIGLFRLGSMEQGEYALKIFNLHAERAYSDGVPEGENCLELGPGDSIASALVANAFGVNQFRGLSEQELTIRCCH